MLATYITITKFDETNMDKCNITSFGIYAWDVLLIRLVDKHVNTVVTAVRMILCI